MIRITKKALSPVPAILSSKGIAATAVLIKRFEEGERHFGSEDFDSAIYNHKEVKESLIAIQDYKCCFCESKIGHISSGDVGHFRPKAGWVQDSEPLNRPGYYWLAYDWDNLFLCCEKCNRHHKRNLFPLSSPTERASSHLSDITKEDPLFIHPVNDNPENFIAFKEDVPFAKDGNVRGDKTITKLGLDRELLNEQRRQTLNKVRDIYEIVKDFPDEVLTKVKARAKLINYYQLSLKDETEYASMLRCFFRDNPINF
jgi:uncharacterized protein (TIGR02646 family)